MDPAKDIQKGGKGLRPFFLHLSSLSPTPVWRLAKAQCIPTRTTVRLSHGYYKILPSHTFILSTVRSSHGFVKILPWQAWRGRWCWWWLGWGGKWWRIAAWKAQWPSLMPKWRQMFFFLSFTCRSDPTTSQSIIISNRHISNSSFTSPSLQPS